MQATLTPVQEFAHCKYEQTERGGEGSDREEKEKKKNKKKKRGQKKKE
jgi:hypothetical protein